MRQEEFVKRAEEYYKLRWNIRNRFHMQESGRRLLLIKNDLQEVVLKMPLRDVIGNMYGRIRPDIKGISLTSKCQYEASLLILKGTSLGIIIRGKLKSQASRRKTGRKKISFEILEGIHSGKFELYSIRKGSKLNMTKHLLSEIHSYDVRHLINFTDEGAKLFDIEREEDTGVEVCHRELFPWMKIHS